MAWFTSGPHGEVCMTSTLTAVTALTGLHSVSVCLGFQSCGLNIITVFFQILLVKVNLSLVAQPPHEESWNHLQRGGIWLASPM